MLSNIELSNGMALKCTPYHKWYINKNSSKCIVYTKDLNIGDVIYEYILPCINNTENNIYSNIDKLFVPINYSINIKLEWIIELLENSIKIDNNILKIKWLLFEICFYLNLFYLNKL